MKSDCKSDNEMIPKLIHQTWKNKRVPAQFTAFTNSWKKHHASWEYRLWDDKDNREFIQKWYPWFLPIFDIYSFDIQRADAVRYFILYKYGGLYVDLDYECFKPVECLLSEKSAAFAIEAEVNCRQDGVKQIISNAFMASEPRHPFFYAVMKSLITYTSKKTGFDQFILDTTGPFMLNRVFENYQNQHEIKLIPSKYVSPLNYREAEAFLKDENSEETGMKLKDAYAVHYHVGSWWKKNE